MEQQADSVQTLPPIPPQQDKGEAIALSGPGENVLKLLKQAADLADGNSRYAVNIARRLSRQLFVAEGRVRRLESRVVELEAEVQHHRENSERAETWLSKISQELQERAIKN